MSTIEPAFFAYPAEPAVVGDTIEQGIANLRVKSGITGVQSWRESDIAGRFIADQVLGKIGDRQLFFADITQLNFNVTYEVGFALAQEKRVVLTRHKGIAPKSPTVAEVGIFDTLGYLDYQNAGELEAIIRGAANISPSLRNTYPLNQSTPVYLIEARFRTDAVTRMISRVKKARLFYRSFDPQESPRLSGSEAFEQLAQSMGVLLHLLPEHIADATIHNLRVAFLAGLAVGFNKVLLLLQDGEEPVPLDYRDSVVVFTHPSQIDEAIAQFATDVTEAMQQTRYYEIEKENTLLERLSFGASAAENELRVSCPSPADSFTGETCDV